MREAIFISHATPEDNNFARWLGVKLELAGYKAWHDLDRLKGGDYFWEKIERAIRDDSFRFLAVVSKVSVGKSGVKDEWAVAATVEKTFPGFVIPIRIDDYDFSLLPIAIHRKNVIDFAIGWHNGFASLLDTLSECKAPKLSMPDPMVVRHWLSGMKEGAVLRTEGTEKLDSTWLPILSLPPTLETARILGRDREIKVTDANRQIPWFEHEDRIVGFARNSDLVELMAKSVMLKAAATVDLNTLLDHGASIGDRYVSKWDGRKRVSNLVRQAWELAMEARGLGIHFQSSGRKVFYVTPELTGGRGEYVSFVDVDGRTRRKALNGRSERKKANWSYAVGMAPAFDNPQRIELRSTIVFSDDDGKPMESVARAQSLRMSFCRSWWNDRWRGFLRAFLALVDYGQSDRRLCVGSNRYVIIGASPIVFTSPVGLSDLVPLIDVDPFDEPEIDFEDSDEIDHEDIPQ